MHRQNSREPTTVRETDNSRTLNIKCSKDFAHPNDMVFHTAKAPRHDALVSVCDRVDAVAAIRGAESLYDRNPHGGGRVGTVEKNQWLSIGWTTDDHVRHAERR